MNLNIDNKIQFTIILPVYNGERYIDEAIQSVLKQTYNDYELIIVDDGSTDETERIIRKYESSQVKIIVTNNKGVSAARNTGMMYATGDYLMFLDCDDKLVTNSLEVLTHYISKNKNIDLIIFGWNEFGLEEKKIKSLNTSGVLDTTICAGKIIQTDSECGGGYPWNKVWKVDSIKVNGYIPNFDEKLILCEDKEWVLRSLLHCKRALLIPETLYLYRRVEGEHLSKINFDEVNKKDYNKIISFLKASENIDKMVSKQRPGTDLSRIARRVYLENLIFVYYKALKKGNIKLCEYCSTYIKTIRKFEFRNIRIKFMAMLLYIALNRMKLK